MIDIKFMVSLVCPNMIELQLCWFAELVNILSEADYPRMLYKPVQTS